MAYSKRALRRGDYAAESISDLDTRVGVVESASGLSEGNLSITNADIASNAAIATTKINGTAVITTDPRLSDARTPSSTLAHASSHATGQSDALDAGDIGAIDLTTFKALVAAAVDYAAFQTAVAAL